MKESAQQPILTTNSIIPSCLKVDIATTFFRSTSKLAYIPAKTIVKIEKILKKSIQRKSNR